MNPDTRRLIFSTLSAVCASAAVVAVLSNLSDGRRPSPPSPIVGERGEPPPVSYHFEDEEFCPGGLSRLAPLARMSDGGCSYVGHLVNTAEGCAVHLFRCPTLPRPSLGAAPSDRTP